MYLKDLNITNFKNILSSELTFENRINCFVGDNGAGKTNFLDAIYYLSLCKSLSGANDKQIISHNGDFFMLEGRYADSNQGENLYNCSFSKSAGKVVRKNAKKYLKISEHIGSVPIVTITPKDNNLIDESADARRKFIDTFISQFDQAYLQALIKYNGILSQRNNVLRTMGSDSKEMLEIYDSQIQPYAELIHSTRKKVIDAMAPLVAKYYSILSGDKEKASVDYKSQLTDSSFQDLFSASYDKDIAMGYTTSGIGRDDIRLMLDGYTIKRYGSQGQQKSFLVSLKLAQYDILYTERGFKPLLLLDDLFDRLDSGRVSRLLGVVSDDKFGQIFITDCDTRRVNDALGSVTGEFSVFKIDSGIVK